MLVTPEQHRRLLAGRTPVRVGALRSTGEVQRLLDAAIKQREAEAPQTKGEGMTTAQWTVEWRETVTYRITVEAADAAEAIALAKDGAGDPPKSVHTEWDDDSFVATEKETA